MPVIRKRYQNAFGCYKKFPQYAFLRSKVLSTRLTNARHCEASHHRAASVSTRRQNSLISSSEIVTDALAVISAGSPRQSKL
ncbi:hypothetical protein Bphy_5857 (plasmid) [Paraburkholderia phymatum STM815]|uniref:Uncharacterized protein n=1 Tax=Paraburkholderia phymatum (strain DSM 17167 / CIP 108236 / LMG 21445 / STM815) TaxID=391038 RepID=B2JVE4_PARP8|nr:hypothetical protein Bphy_5857 [Paraburkholderia phymatum STM815]